MLNKASVAPTLPVADLARARNFYENKLGLKPLQKREFGVLYECGNGTTLFIYQSMAGKDKHVVAAFEVSNLEREVKQLKEKGVITEQCDIPACVTIEKTAAIGQDKAAWFEDSEGNVLVIIQIGMLVEIQESMFSFARL